MAEFLTTSDISSNLEKIIKKSNGKVILVSPYLQLSKTLCERLKDAADNKTNIKIIYGKEENLKPAERNFLAQLKNVEIYFFENLHAKCYFNESLMIISSMNMYEFSEKNNREMGILLKAKDDREIFQEAVNEVKSIIANAQRKTFAATPAKNAFPAVKELLGVCIRCAVSIPHNTGKPYCANCYSSWAVWENVFFVEKYCHSCGAFEQTTIEKPECYNCYISNY